MTVFDVCMVIIGLVLIGVSFFFTEKAASKGKNERMANSIGLDEDILLAFQNTVEENLEKISESIIVKTENNLNKVTNEKIMAISDYSEQILEKIDQNHTEVVFLYNMLNEKENTMKKDYCKEVNQTTNTDSKVRESVNQTNSNNSTLIGNIITKSTRDIQGINDDEAAMLTNSTTSKKKIKSEDSMHLFSADNLEMEQSARVLSVSRSDSDNMSDKHLEQEFTEEDEQNNNQEIMKLYAEGKSITEIAKTLDLGKGEVSFVLNLYKQN